ncbi:MAG TPA: TRAP transporter fused permease subunit [Burkholderiales bacterium]|nr:TRAP transporter fused permease subunit [Burkholderiales bacterium]
MVLFSEQFAAAAYGIGLALTFLRFRVWKLDWALAMAALVLLGYVTVRFPTLTAIAGSVNFETMTVSAGITALTVEATRRTIGWSLVIILLGLAGYVLIGHLVPGQLQTREVDIGQLLGYLNLDNNGLLGLVLQITVIVIIPFVLMGQLLMRSGGSSFFNDAAIALMGRYRGGAAKMAVVGSSLFGMISGIAAANTVAVGIVTIPLMKRSGMSPRLAGAVEACASNGGQLMPPVMGAVAFVMADFLQIPYKEVAIAAILPSVMYYAALFIQADLEAARYGFGKVEQAKIPRIGKVLARGWLFIVPFAVLIYTMFWLNLEPEYSAMAASAAIIVLGFAFGYDGHRMTLRDLWMSVVETAGGLCEILVISAAAGFIMGLFQVSGLAFAFAAYLVELGGQSLILLLLLAAVVSIILGMGLPTIGVYVMLAVLVAPALVKVGVPPLAAHLFILYFGMMSLITPPVAPAAYVAAAIAQAPSMATGWTAMRFGWSAYIVPFLFVYSPAILLQGRAVDIVAVSVSSLFGIWLVCAAMTGFLTRVLSIRKRILFALAGIMLLSPHQASEMMLWINIAGALAGIALIAYELKARRAYVRA